MPSPAIGSAAACGLSNEAGARRCGRAGVARRTPAPMRTAHTSAITSGTALRRRTRRRPLRGALPPCAAGAGCGGAGWCAAVGRVSSKPVQHPLDGPSAFSGTATARTPRLPLSAYTGRSRPRTAEGTRSLMPVLSSRAWGGGDQAPQAPLRTMRRRVCKSRWPLRCRARAHVAHVRAEHSGLRAPALQGVVNAGARGRCRRRRHTTASRRSAWACRGPAWPRTAC